MKQSQINQKSESQDEMDPYQPANVPLFEAIYGQHLISLGGNPAIENMFNDINIKGSQALDLGFGLGGVAYYLAQHYHMKISGIETQSWMVQYAKEHVPKQLAHTPEFHTYAPDGTLPFAPQVFDLVYSKGVLNHVSDKACLFREVYRVLKHSGLFVIADWIFPEKSTDTVTPLVCETKETYEHYLKEAGFSAISFRDDSKLFLVYAQELLGNLALHREFIESKYDKALYSMIQKQHEDLIAKIQDKAKVATRIIAKASGTSRD